MIDLILAILKFGGLLLSGVFGAYGLLVKFKDENGKVTGSGRNALMLIVISTLVGGLSASFELYRDKVRQRTAVEIQSRETLETAKRTEKLLSEINRSIQPISSLTVSYWITVPTDHPLLEPYISRFEVALPKALSRLTARGSFPGFVGSSYAGGSLTSVDFNRSSALSPDKSKEKLAFSVLGYSDMELHFFRSPIDPKLNHLVRGDFKMRPDLIINISSGLGVPGMGGDHNLEYNLKGKRFAIQGFDISSDSAYWYSTGRIVSIPDLAGSQIFIHLPSIFQSGDVGGVDQYLPAIRRRFSLDRLVLNFGKGREFWLQSKDMEKIDSNDKFPLYVYTFPKTVDELKELSLASPRVMYPDRGVFAPKP